MAVGCSLSHITFVIRWCFFLFPPTINTKPISILERCRQVHCQMYGFFGFITGRRADLQLLFFCCYCLNLWRSSGSTEAFTMVQNHWKNSSTVHQYVLHNNPLQCCGLISGHNYKKLSNMSRTTNRHCIATTEFWILGVLATSKTMQCGWDAQAVLQFSTVDRCI